MKTEERLAVVETKIEDVCDDVKTMRTNELPHIAKNVEVTNKEVNKINTNFKVYKAKTAVWAGIGIFVATIVSTAITQILIKLFVK